MATTQGTTTRPNIVFILCDNVGWGDFSCYGGNMLMQRIDRLESALPRITPLGHRDWQIRRDASQPRDTAEWPAISEGSIRWSHCSWCRRRRLRVQWMSRDDVEGWPPGKQRPEYKQGSDAYTNLLIIRCFLPSQPPCQLACDASRRRSRKLGSHKPYCQ